MSGSPTGGSGVLVLQHQDDAGPGNLATWLDDARVPWELVDVVTGELPPVTRRAGLVILGSRESVYDDTVPWLPAEKAFLRATLATGTPVLGLCFGAQLLAEALGGQVRRAAVAERGWVPTFADADAPIGDIPGIAGRRWFAWHQDEVLPPADCTVLARSDACIQAFSHGDHLGLQFHPEVTSVEIGRWFDDHRRRDQADGTVDEILRESEDRVDDATRAAAGLYTTFFQHTGVHA